MIEQRGTVGDDDMSRGELVFFNLDRLTSGLLRHWMPERRCLVALDLDDLGRIVDRDFGPAVVIGVDMPRKKLDELIRWSMERINHPNRPCIFGVQSVKLAIPDPVFLQAGFAAVFYAGWPSRQIEDLASRHWRSLDWPPEPAESRYRRMMPFRG